MKRRERTWHWLHETWCFLWGHNWKSSWRHRPDRDWAMSLSDAERKAALPYARRMSGNYLMEESQGWHHKCRRCRLRTRDGAWLPWHRDFWSALHNGWISFRIGVTCYHPFQKRREGVGYTTYPWWGWPLSIVAAPFFGFGQAWAHLWFRGWPFWPGAVAFYVHDKLAWKVEDAGTRWDWMPPDSGHPNEVGFWSRRTEGDQPRARMYLNTGEGFSATSGNGETAVIELTDWGRPSGAGENDR